MFEYRAGHGYDVHRLVEGRPLILGGVNIMYELGLAGHSDADVLAHAVMDAMLGAAALGDIGSHFPDSDDQYKDADSMELLKTVDEKLRSKGFFVTNIDATIIAQKPRLMPYIGQMVENIADTLRISRGCVNVKATTTELLGFTGRMEGIACHAVCMVKHLEV